MKLTKKLKRYLLKKYSQVLSQQNFYDTCLLLLILIMILSF